MSAASHLTGMVGEGRFIAFAASQGWEVYRGMDGHTKYDYIADTPEGLKRVEVKRVESVQRSDNGYYYCTVTKLGKARDRFDYIYVSTPDGDYFIPASAAPADTLSIKQQQEPGTYQRNITRPGKYEEFRV